jgi:exodeoxyribonuclease VII large subunit
LHTALDRLTTNKRRRFSAVHVRFAALDLRARVGKLHRACEQRFAEMRTRMDRLLVARRRRLESAVLRLQERSPFQLLERGYAIVYDAGGRVLRSPDQADLGDEIVVRLARGQLDATVRGKKKLD